MSNLQENITKTLREFPPLTTKYGNSEGTYKLAKIGLYFESNFEDDFDDDGDAYISSVIYALIPQNYKEAGFGQFLQLDEDDWCTVSIYHRWYDIDLSYAVTSVEFIEASELDENDVVIGINEHLQITFTP